MQMGGWPYEVPPLDALCKGPSAIVPFANMTMVAENLTWGWLWYEAEPLVPGVLLTERGCLYLYWI